LAYLFEQLIALKLDFFGGPILLFFPKERQCIPLDLLFSERNHAWMDHILDRQFLQSLFTLESFWGNFCLEFFVVPLSYT